MLPSDIPHPVRISGSGSDTPEPPSTEELALIRQELKADMAFPDRRDHKEISLWSLSESATGQERRESYNFSFDKVSFFSLLFDTLHSFAL